MIIDSHQHFWQYNAVRDAWITNDMKVIQRSFMPKDLAPLLVDNDIEGCVAVQADQSADETLFLLNLAAEHDFIKGVVGWIDLQSDTITEQLSQYANHSKLKGFRHIVQAEADGFLSGSRFMKGIKALGSFRYTYDVLIRYQQLPETTAFVKQFPNQPFVVDHLAKPSIKDKEFKCWSREIAALAACENVYCKLSGMVTEADWANWSKDDFKPYVDWIIKCFGTTRVMYGSDWPVCTLAASYQRQLAMIQSLLASFSEYEKSRIMRNNAIQFYDL